MNAGGTHGCISSVLSKKRLEKGICMEGRMGSIQKVAETFELGE